VKDILYSQEYVDMLSTKVSPFIIFDESGKILYNNGALEYIDKNIAVHRDDSNGTRFDIFIKMDKWLKNDPILTILDRSDLRMVRPIRKNNELIIYKLYEPNFGWGVSYNIPSEEIYPLRYRLEIVPN